MLRGWRVGSQEVTLKVKEQGRGLVLSLGRMLLRKRQTLMPPGTGPTNTTVCFFHRAKGNAYEPGSEPGSLPVAESEIPGLPISSLLSQGLLWCYLGMLATGSWFKAAGVVCGNLSFPDFTSIPGAGFVSCVTGSLPTRCLTMWSSSSSSSTVSPSPWSAPKLTPTAL